MRTRLWLLIALLLMAVLMGLSLVACGSPASSPGTGTPTATSNGY